MTPHVSRPNVARIDGGAASIAAFADANESRRTGAVTVVVVGEVAAVVGAATLMTGAVVVPGLVRAGDELHEATTSETRIIAVDGPRTREQYFSCLAGVPTSIAWRVSTC
jgi:hypothetical protein